MHQVTFPRAYSVALLCTNTFTGPRFSLYGWKDGVLSERGFHVLDAASPIVVSANTSAIGGPANAASCACQIITHYNNTYLHDLGGNSADTSALDLVRGFSRRMALGQLLFHLHGILLREGVTAPVISAH